MNKIKEFLINNAKILQSIAALIAILVFVVGIFKLFFETADVEATMTLTDANLPSSIAAKYGSTLNALSIYTKADTISLVPKSVVSEANEVSTFLYKTSQKAVYEITNNSKYTLKNIDIRIKNVRELTAWGVSGNMLQSIESSSIMKTMREDPESGIITFSSIEKIPPSSTLVITIWGNIRQYSFEDPINVTYDGGSAKVVKTSTVKGADSFIYENISFLFVLFIVLDIALVLSISDAYISKLKKADSDSENL